MAVTSKPKPATAEDLRAMADHDRLEIIGGEIVEKALSSPDHSFPAIRIGGALHGFNRRPGPRGPGGNRSERPRLRATAAPSHRSFAPSWRRGTAL
jgi:hypothetical protein